MNNIQVGDIIDCNKYIRSGTIFMEYITRFNVNKVQFCCIIKMQYNYPKETAFNKNVR